MLVRPALPFIMTAVLMLAGCGGESGEGVSTAADEISSPFTEAVLANLNISPDDVAPALGESHDRHFEHLGHLAFEDSVILGYISHVRVRDDGTLLLVDQPGRSAHLFSASGRHLQSLDPTECDPGVNWMPRHGAFLSDGRVVVSNNDARSTIRFSGDGACEQFIEPDMGPAEDFAPLEHGGFVTHEESFEQQWLAERDADGAEIRTFGHSGEFVNLNFRMGARNFLAAFPDGHVAVGLPHQSAPTVYSPSDTAGTVLFEPPSDFRILEEDIRDTRGMRSDEMMNEIRDFFTNHTLIMSMYALSDETLMVVYRNGFREPEDEDYMAIHVSDLDGRPLTVQPVTWPGQIEGESSGFFPVFAKDNLVFTVRPAEELPNGDWGNPGLHVWRFAPPG